MNGKLTENMNMKWRWGIKGLVVLGAGVILLVILAAAFPGVSEAMVAKANQAKVYLSGVVSPAGDLPTPEATANPTPETVVTAAPVETLIASDTAKKTAPEQVKAALPPSASLTAPVFDSKLDYQDWNNCGPATLALGLRMFGWTGDQFTISTVVKPEKQDKNVNIEELRDYVNQNTNGLRAEFRVGGDLETLKRYLALGYPVIIEESFRLTESFWPGDDRWAAHYLLLTGYDDVTSQFTTQDSYYGPNRLVGYADLMDAWRSFNHVYLVIFPVEQVNSIRTLMGDDSSEISNRERTVLKVRAQLNLTPGDAFGWFNLGSNLVYLENYQAASEAFATARRLGLPQRMLRYQFGPFAAEFQTHQVDDLKELLDYSLRITPDSEEAFLWRGLVELQGGDKKSAIGFFQKALDAHPGYRDAINAIKSITTP
jgi:tetratricopeptide (TPR) repeat protein